MRSQQLKRYLSDTVGDRHRSLTVLTPEAQGKAKQSQFVIIDRLLARAQKTLPEQDFQAGMTEIGRKYWTLDTEASLAIALRQLGGIGTRHNSPGKRRADDSPENIPPKVADRQRRSDVFAKERAEAQQDLEYTYVPMETEKS